MSGGCQELDTLLIIVLLNVPGATQSHRPEQDLRRLSPVREEAIDVSLENALTCAEANSGRLQGESRAT
jgi:hypothetical protein